MNYKIKAVIQNCIAALPTSLSYEVYYKFQRKFGGLKNINPTPKFYAAEKIKNIGRKVNFSIKGAKILEIGSGRSPIVPLYLWLHGATRVTTCDLNPYFKEELWIESIQWIRKSKILTSKVFSEAIPDRMMELTSNDKFITGGKILKTLHNIGIDYLAPADACMLPFEDDYFDAHISYTVLEHIPRNIIINIFSEAKRIVRPGGVAIHNIDYTDHFAYSDQKISKIHFLRYTDSEFKRLAGNRFMYMNRLRDDDFRAVWDEICISPITEERSISEEIIKESKTDKGLVLNKKFADKNLNDLATIESWYAFKM